MKCFICGKETNPPAFCSRCGAYVADDLGAPALDAAVDVEAIEVKRNMSVAEYSANFRVGLFVNVVLVVFFALFLAVMLSHLAAFTINIKEIVFLSLPFSFLLAALMGIFRYVPTVKHLKAICSADFCLFRRFGSSELDCVCAGRVYRCVLRSGYTFAKKDKRLCLCKDGAVRAIDVARLQAFFAREGAQYVSH